LTPRWIQRSLYIAYSKARVSRHNPIVPESPSIAIGKHQTPRTRVKGPHSLTDLAKVDRSPGVGSIVKWPKKSSGCGSPEPVRNRIAQVTTDEAS
jgi:hypothetical protein